MPTPDSVTDSSRLSDATARARTDEMQQDAAGGWGCPRDSRILHPPRMGARGLKAGLETPSSSRPYTSSPKGVQRGEAPLLRVWGYPRANMKFAPTWPFCCGAAECCWESEGVPRSHFFSPPKNGGQGVDSEDRDVPLPSRFSPVLQSGRGGGRRGYHAGSPSHQEGSDSGSPLAYEVQRHHHDH